MSTPKVINLRNYPDGLPANAVRVDRRTAWGNPFKIGREWTREAVIARYAAWVVAQPSLIARLDELRGKDLACWCSPLKCHGDFLLELANKETTQ